LSRGEAHDRRAVSELAALAESHLVRGTVYAHAGLMDDAEREWSAFLARNPESEVATALLRQLRESGRIP
jgi:hypothetical protein